jgi:hypothetical protein
MKRGPICVAMIAIVSCALGEARAQFLGTNFVSGNADGAIAATSTSMAVGSNAVAVGVNSTAVGFDVLASLDDATAVGHSASAMGINATAIGSSTHADATSATAIGGNSDAGTGATAVGAISRASGVASAAFGAYTRAEGFCATALGTDAKALGAHATAVGQNAIASGDRSTAIGSGASATREGQIAIGTANNTYTAPGITTAASTAAQTGPTQFVTTDAQGNLAAANLDEMGYASNEDVERNSEGVSMAMALSGVPSVLPENANFAVSSDIGIFDNETAVALGGAARLSDNVYLNGGGAVSTSSGYGGGRAGFTFAW